MHKPFFILFLILSPAFSFSQSKEFKQIRSILKTFKPTPKPDDSSFIKKALIDNDILPSIYNSDADIEFRIIITANVGSSVVFSIKAYKDSLIADKITFFWTIKDNDLTKPGYANFKSADVTNKSAYILSGEYKLIYTTEAFKLPIGFNSWAEIFEQLKANQVFTGIDGEELNRRVKKHYPETRIVYYGTIEIDIKNKAKYRSVKFDLSEYNPQRSGPNLIKEVPGFKYYINLIDITYQLKTLQK